MLSDAICFATAQHAKEKQTRSGSGLPYITHPLEVMNLLLRHGVHDQDVLAAAVLHDVVEDCPVPAAEIASRFGPVVAEIVAAVTKPAEGSKAEKKQRALALLKAGPSAARMVKMADRLSNILDIETLDWAPARKADYLHEAAEIARLGAVDHPALSSNLARTAREKLAALPKA